MSHEVNLQEVTLMDDVMRRSTENVENAFNSVSWNGPLNELQKRGISPYLHNMIDSYFDGRTLLVEEASIFEVTCGVPQWTNARNVETFTKETLSSIVNCLEDKEQKGSLPGCLSGTMPCESTRVSNKNSRSVLARTPPIDLLVQKRNTTEQRSNSSGENIRNNMPDRWQNRWCSNTGRATWTKTLRIRGIDTEEHTFFECPMWAPEGL
ncbi:hypothetical protein Trydic_g14123 [Trypoxylus dichotomus]